MQLIKLNQPQRIEAHNSAVDVVKSLAKPRPKRQDFASDAVHKYPAALVNFVVALCAGFLIVAFVPSSIRLWHIGSSTFGEAYGINSRAAMQLVGYCIVLLAEIGAVLFTLAWAVLETKLATRFILGFSIIASASIALVGNFEIGIWRAGHVTPFTWLETLLPPLMTLATSFILKEVALDRVKSYHAANVNFHMAVKAWEQEHSKPEKHPQFKAYYANAIKDMLIAVNGQGRGATERKAYMASLNDNDWSRLVAAIMRSDSWYDDNEPDNEQPRSTNVQGVQTTKPVQSGLQPAMAHRTMGFVQNVSDDANVPNANPSVEATVQMILANPDMLSLSQAKLAADPRVPINSKGSLTSQVMNDPRVKALRGE